MPVSALRGVSTGDVDPYSLMAPINAPRQILEGIFFSNFSIAILGKYKHFSVNLCSESIFIVARHRRIIYVFSDCKNAIDTVTKKTQVNRHPEIFQKVQHVSMQLHEFSCCVNVVKIPSHKGIHGNILADQKAKELAQMIVNEKISAPEIIGLSVSDARQTASGIAKKSWQRKCNEESKGRSTL